MLFATIFLLLPLALPAQNVLTWHNDVSRTGQNLKETTLTLANVNSTQFGLKFTLSVDGHIFTQPLYVSNVYVSGRASTTSFTWQPRTTACMPSTPAAAPPPALAHQFHGAWSLCGSLRRCRTCEISPTIGITGTPVINRASNTLYVVAFTLESGTYYQRLHALDITSGAEKFGGPVVIKLRFRAGAGNVGGIVTFTPLLQNQRSALPLSGGVVYIAWASFADLGDYHGWVMGYNASSLAQVSVFNDTPNGSQGGIWQSAGGLSADSTGNLYLTTGNGTFDVNTGGIDYGDSFLKMTNTLAVTDYFTPDNEQKLVTMISTWAPVRH